MSFILFNVDAVNAAFQHLQSRDTFTYRLHQTCKDAFDAHLQTVNIVKESAEQDGAKWEEIWCQHANPLAKLEEVFIEKCRAHHPELFDLID